MISGYDGDPPRQFLQSSRNARVWSLNFKLAARVGIAVLFPVGLLLMPFHRAGFEHHFVLVIALMPL